MYHLHDDGIGEKLFLWKESCISQFVISLYPLILVLFGLIVGNVSAKEMHQLSMSDTMQVDDLLASLPSPMFIDLPLSLSLLEKADSLVTQLEQDLDRHFTKRKVDIVFWKGQCLYFQGAFDAGIAEIQAFLSKQEASAAPGATSRIYDVLGGLYKGKGNLIEARKNHLLAIQFSPDRYSAGAAYNNLGLVEHMMGALFDASLHFKMALVIFDSLNAPVEHKSSIRMNWGLVYYDLDSLDRAEAQLWDAFKLVDSIPNSRVKGRIYLNLSAVYLKQSMWTQTISMLDSALHESIQIDDPFLQAKIRLQRVIALLFMHGDMKRIQYEIEEAETLIKSYQFDGMSAELELEKGNIEKYKGNYSQAKNHYILALHEAIQLGSYTAQMDLLHKLAHVDSLQGNMVSAMTYFQRYHHISDSLSQIKKDRAIDNIQMEYDLQKSEKEKEVISRELALSKSQSQQRFYFLLALMGILIVILIALIIIAFQRNRLVHMWKIIDKQNHRMKNMFQERQLILKLITHDLRSPLMRIQVIVANLLDNWEGNKEKEIRAEIAEIAHAATEIEHFSERIINAEDQPENLEINQISRTKLNQRLEFAIEKYQTQAFNKGIKINNQFLNEETTIQTHQEALQLILENLLSNAIKYAPLNSEIDTCLTLQSDGYYYTIRDRGPGFQESDFTDMFKQFQTLSAQPTNGEPSQGMGLYLSQKLSNQIGALLKVYNHPEKGAVASLVIPINP